MSNRDQILHQRIVYIHINGHLILFLGLQVALKCTRGISYFDLFVPLHVLFIEKGQLAPEEWLQMWKADEREGSFVVKGFQLESLSDLKRILLNHNVFMIAERIVDSVVYFI